MESQGRTLNPVERILTSKFLSIVNCQHLEGNWILRKRRELLIYTKNDQMVLIGGWLNFVLCWGILKNSLEWKKIGGRNPRYWSHSEMSNGAKLLAAVQWSAAPTGQYLSPSQALPGLRRLAWAANALLWSLFTVRVGPPCTLLRVVIDFAPVSAGH